MLRNIGSIVVGLVAWVVIVSILDRCMRIAWPEYAAALPTFAFTLPMMFARLSEAAITTIIGGLVNRLLARTPLWPAAIQGVIILLFFLPIHYKVWHSFPVWYHLTFLGSLIPLTLVGAALVPQHSAKAAA